MRGMKRKQFRIIALLAPIPPMLFVLPVILFARYHYSTLSTIFLFLAVAVTIVVASTVVFINFLVED